MEFLVLYWARSPIRAWGPIIIYMPVKPGKNPVPVQK